MYLSSLTELALASRLKSLSDRFYNAGDEVYRNAGARIESRWFPVMRFLWEQGPATVNDVAAAIGQTHSAVSQLTDKLVRAGMAKRQGDAADGRRSLLTLTTKGSRALAELGIVWAAIRQGVKDSLGAEGTQLLAAIEACERALDEQPIVPNILNRHAALAASKVVIVPFRTELREHFHALNAAWLRKYFVIEPIDEKVLRHPEEFVLKPGGAVFFAMLGDEVIGTCALLRDAPGVYELTKMAVDESFRGLGAGRQLLDAAIDEFRRGKGTMLFLESSKKLKPALHMYQRAGFVLQSANRPDSHYARADVYMIYAPPKKSAAKPRKRIAGKA
ncbi:helix-turn-helix domain-containing GNAT family N-acetyltransferase [Rhodanobacter sp. L36]|uniref:bifunctional helix-turn-helix transcriptional regulator/GNAT family N-acetyltransferase n=1 Tax=Rhodanobacter sp. L36 TaxID=1747221 RepID=UPI00131CA233|nr:helix-turn-helix domain-containing GNAT family N-acetyltransferase [Rhodanobacter sp. L36]